jgi:hypothetical protein
MLKPGGDGYRGVTIEKLWGDKVKLFPSATEQVRSNFVLVGSVPSGRLQTREGNGLSGGSDHAHCGGKPEVGANRDGRRV